MRTTPVLKIGQRVELHTNKDYMLLNRNNGRSLTCPLGCVAVYAPKRPEGSQWFAPETVKDGIANPRAYCSR